MDLVQSDVDLQISEGKIYFINAEDELTMIYNYEEEQLDRWVIESLELIDSDTLELLVRTNYVDNNQEPILEARSFSIVFTKSNDEWFISEVILN